MSELRGGIDLGGTKIQAVVVDEANQALGQARRDTPTTGGPSDVAAEMVAALTEAAADADVEIAALRAVGACGPGDVDKATGVVARAKNLPGWADTEYPLAEDLGKRLDAAVRIDNDVNVATYGEFRLGAGRPYDSLLGVFWGTGVGGGLILDGRVWTGRGGAGEIGHTVVKRGGAQCGCGRQGCMEAYAGRRSMETAAREEHAKGKKTDLFKIMEDRRRERLTSGVWGRALKHDDKLARHLMQRAVEALGTGIASAINLLDVPAVVLGGGMGLRFGPELRDEIEAEMLLHLFNDAEPPALLVAELGDLGGAIGAALLVEDGEQA